MTAEQPPSQLFPIPTFTTSTTHGDVDENTNNDLTKKRRRLIIEEEEEMNRFDLESPPGKSPRRNDHVTKEQDTENLLADVLKMNHQDVLLAYKRIWEKLDLSKPTDAKLEPFVWHKIREHQQRK